MRDTENRNSPKCKTDKIRKMNARINQNTRINHYILSIFLKLHNFLIVFIVISAPSIFSFVNTEISHLKSMVYENAVQNELLY